MAVLHTIALPGSGAPAAGFEAPFEMLAACHERVERMLALMARLRQHLLDKGGDDAARQAAIDVMRYFDQAAPLHHQDEELHVFPALLATADARVKGVVGQLLEDHRQMEALWADVRSALQAVVGAADTAPPADGAPQAAAFALSAGQLSAMDRFNALYQRHLQDEDGTVYPAAQAVIDAPARQKMGEDMMVRRGVRL